MSEPIATRTRKQQGSIKVLVGGKIVHRPVELTIETTQYADGLTDCTVKVPRIALQATREKETE